MKSAKPIPADKKTGTKKTSVKAEEIKTDSPLSEKDEVKKAENNLQKSQKKRG